MFRRLLGGNVQADPEYVALCNRAMNVLNEHLTGEGFNAALDDIIFLLQGEMEGMLSTALGSRLLTDLREQTTLGPLYELHAALHNRPPRDPRFRDVHKHLLGQMRGEILQCEALVGNLVALAIGTESTEGVRLHVSAREEARQGEQLSDEHRRGLSIALARLEDTDPHLVSQLTA